MRKQIQSKLTLTFVTLLIGCTAIPPTLESNTEQTPETRTSETTNSEIKDPEIQTPELESPNEVQSEQSSLDNRPPETSDSESKGAETKGEQQVSPSTKSEDMAVPDGLMQFRGNNTRSFFGTGPISDKEPQQIWQFETDKYVSKSGREWMGLGWTGQPAIAKEQDRWVVYAGSLDGYVYKLDLLTGELIHRSEKNLQIIKSSPALTDEFVVVGSWANAMHLLDRYSLEVIHQEEAVYTPSVSYDFDGSAAIEDGFAYFGGEDGYVRKISLTHPYERLWIYPSEAPQSEFRYKNRKEPYVGIESSVAIYQDHIIVGTGRGEVLILNKHSGKLIESFNSGDDTDATPVIDTKDGSIYIGVEKDNTENPGGMLKLNSEGQKQWYFEVGATGIYSSAVLHQDKVIFTADDSYLYAVYMETGKLAWKRKLDASSWSSPALVDGRVITADYAGVLYNFDANTGDLIWKKQLSDYVAATPAIWNGIIVIGTRDGLIQAFK